MSAYRSPPWLVGGNAQTIWPALYSRPAAKPQALSYTRERWDTPDGDFVDVDFGADLAPQRPFLVLFHGLEGSSQSHYARAFAQHAAAGKLGFAVPHFRGCSGEINRAPRAYHSGDYEEIGWILRRFRQRLGPARELRAVGVSLGGNALMRWAEEAGHSAAATARGVVSISSPLDLTESGLAIGRGFNRLVYTRMFLRTMKPRALARLAQHPGLFDKAELLAARDLYEFDNLFTAPVHGFKNTDDYWSRASAKPGLKSLRIPGLMINARNDPFVPAYCLPSAADINEFGTLEQPAHGGHVGFAQGRFPGQLDWLAQRVERFFDGL